VTYKKTTFLNVDKYFSQRPLGYLQLSFITNPEHYRMLFEGVQDQRMIGECSTSYLFSKMAAKNIHEYNPLSKIIIIIRDPVERAFSHYMMALRFGFTTLPFREAIEKDRRKRSKGWGISELFIELGEYYEQIERYLKLFPETNVAIYLFDELKYKTDYLMNKITGFLGFDTRELSSTKKHNRAKIPKYKALNKIVVDTGLKNFSKKVFPESVINKLKKVSFSDENLPVLEPEDREFLQDIYHNNITKTAELIGTDLSPWFVI